MFLDRLGLKEKHAKILFILIVISLILKTLLINQDITIILSKFLADDSYYYYVLAKNVVSGHGLVFNQGIPTNGFHPLYALILLPLFKYLHSYGTNIPIYASLIVLIIFNTATAILLYLIGKKLLNKNAGLLAAFIWLFNPFITFTSLIGVETPIQIFFISLLIYFMIIKRDKERAHPHDAIFIGALLGLIFLSRLDGIFIGIGVIAALLLRRLIKQRKPNLTRLKNILIHHKPNILIIILIAFLVVLPWLLISWLEVGRIIPISGSALRLIQLDSSASNIKLLVGAVFTPARHIVSQFFMIRVWSPIYIVFTLALILLIPAIIILIKMLKDKSAFLFKLIRSLDFLIIASVLYYLYYWFYALAIREWYAIYTNLWVTIIFSTTIIYLIQKTKFKKTAYTLLIGVLIFSFIIGSLAFYTTGNYPQEKLKWEIAQHINENIPLHENLGSFNTGIYQYYTPNHEIINLDGVMNPEAYEALKEGTIEDYILRKNITYIVDEPAYTARINTEKISLTPIKEFNSPVYLYRIGEPVEADRQIYKIFKVELNEK